MTDAALEEKLFPKTPKASPTKQMPDFNYILKNGVNKKLLWIEYLETCRQSGSNPLVYSQFCYYIQQDEQQRRATMHIARKPGEDILAAGRDKVLAEKKKAAEPNPHALTWGLDYYRR